MFRLSPEGIERLAGDLVAALARSHSVVLLKSREAVEHSVRQVLGDEFRREEEREKNARRRMAAMKDAPRAGTREFEELFRKLIEEEHVREADGA